MPIPTNRHGNLQPGRRRHRVTAPLHRRLRDSQELPRHQSQGPRSDCNKTLELFEVLNLRMPVDFERQSDEDDVIE